MKIFCHLISAVVISACAASAVARDRIENFSIEEALASEEAQAILGQKIKYYFGDQPHPTIVKEFVEHSSHRKTNGSNKSDKNACNWVFLSNLKEMREHAEKHGANAVVNIRSNYRDNPTSSTDTFKCASGLLMSDVALIADIVQIEE